MNSPIRSGAHGDPPRIRRQDYHKVLRQLLWRMRLDLIAWILVVAVIVFGSLFSNLTLSASAISVIGIAVSIFIAFRNTQAMSRWWEARALWGTIMNGSRIWRDLMLGLLPTEQLATQRGRQLLDYQVAKVWLLNFELRNFWRADVHEAVTALLGNLKLPADTSLQELCRQQARAVQRLHSDGWVDSFGRMQLLDGINSTTSPSALWSGFAIRRSHRPMTSL